MPELPEVQIVGDRLSAALENRPRITEVRFSRKKLRYPVPRKLVSQILTEERISRIQRHGKYLIFLTARGSILNHLGMSGSWRLQADSAPLKKHDHMLWKLDDGRSLIFSDPRRFGLVLASSSKGRLEYPQLAQLGPDPLRLRTKGLCALYPQIQKRRGPIKSLLLNQSFIAGIGNIYACEALFRARISPFRPSYKLSSSDWSRLSQGVEDVLREAIAAGGSTIKDFEADGHMGHFQNSFSVYGRENALCSRCHEPIQREWLAGRSTFYCSSCQV